MKIEDLIEHKIIPIIDPSTPDSPAHDGANAFLAEYGGFVEEVALVCKKEDGKVTYRSAVAPSDRVYENFFTDFTELANDLGMKCHALAYAYGDAFMGNMPDYAIARSDGTALHSYVDPAMEAYWKHLKGIAQEVARKPIHSLLFQEFLFPRQEYPFSRHALRKFSEISGVSFDTTYSDIQRDPSVQRMFEEWRSNLITTAFREIVDLARSEHTGLEIAMVVPVDPETEWNSGFNRHFGINLDRIIEISGYVIFQIMPYSPMYPEPGTPGWDTLVRALRSSSLYEATGYKKALFVWGLANEEDIDWINRLKEEINAERVFGRLDHPPKYTEKREIHRGV